MSGSIDRVIAAHVAAGQGAKPKSAQSGAGLKRLSDTELSKEPASPVRNAPRVRMEVLCCFAAHTLIKNGKARVSVAASILAQHVHPLSHRRDRVRVRGADCEIAIFSTVSANHN